MFIHGITIPPEDAMIYGICNRLSMGASSVFPFLAMFRHLLFSLDRSTSSGCLCTCSYSAREGISPSQAVLGDHLLFLCMDDY